MKKKDRRQQSPIHPTRSSDEQALHERALAAQKALRAALGGSVLVGLTHRTFKTPCYAVLVFSEDAALQVPAEVDGFPVERRAPPPVEVGARTK